MQTLMEYVDQCNAELEAAKNAPAGDVRFAHLQRAYRYAWLAVEERAKESNVTQWHAGRRERARVTYGSPVGMSFRTDGDLVSNRPLFGSWTAPTD